MPTPIDFSIQHAIPGRLRVTVPVMISNRKVIEILEGLISETPGVIRVRTNHYSGSVTIFHDSQRLKRADLLGTLDRLIPEAVALMTLDLAEVVETNAGEVDSGMDKAMWNKAARILGGAGSVGILLPLCPGIPLLVLAAFCKAKANGKKA